jgi:hypothetical protein
MKINEPSKGEQKIINILQRHNIKCRREIEFSDLKGSHGAPLRFDIGVYNNQNQLICLIEYDSEIHFQFVKFFHKTITNFNKRKGYDRIKNRYCIRKNIPLIRIPYWDLENLTFEQIFNNPAYRVRSIYHNDYLGGIK